MKEQKVLNNLIERKIIPSQGKFEINEFIIDEYLDEYHKLFGNSSNGLKRKSNLKYAKKLAAISLIKLNKNRNNKIKISNTRNIDKEGFIYILENPIYPGIYKIGLTRNLESRLQSYLVCDPYKKCKFVYTHFTPDVINCERKVLQYFSEFIINGEWIRSKVENIINCIKQNLVCEPNGKATDC